MRNQCSESRAKVLEHGSVKNALPVKQQCMFILLRPEYDDDSFYQLLVLCACAVVIAQF